MKKIIIVSALFALAGVCAQAQGTITFANSASTKVSTNGVVGVPAIAPTATLPQQYFYALFFSPSATSVNGQSAAIIGATNVNYAFNDTNWTLVAYGSNMFQYGQFLSGNPGGNSSVAVPGVAGGSTAHFVVIGWFANAGKTISALQSWFNGGNPDFNGWIGQSPVSGAITLGTSSGATLFGTSAPEIPGFTLGLVTPPSPVPPTITAQPVGQTALSGTSVTFSVSAYGTPAPAYQWMFNSTNVIAGATGASYKINNVQPTNNGTYSVVITNTAGSTNSTAVTLTVNPGPGYITFAGTALSGTPMYTNTAVGGPAAGLTLGSGSLYYYALYASASATSVLGQTASILGATSTDYAFNDGNWTLVAYGTNSAVGSLSALGNSWAVSVPGISGGTPGQFVVIGWSVNVGTTIADVESWFNGGAPASNGWIGQSAVSGAITLGAGGIYPTPPLFGTNAPQTDGFTLGLASPTPHAAYTVPALVQTALSANVLQLSWPTASGSWGVQSAASPLGPWSNTGWMVTVDGVTSTVTVTNPPPSQFYRLASE